ncbi:MAG: hypothetical protein U9N76_04500 [Candidatus Marinimicrobia bacterium]|nr:hypothetical protein [Candidatus Neomarinimicrobiota bacterium]
MHKTIKQLIKLQALDSNLKSIDDKLGNLPEVVKTLNYQIEEKIEENKKNAETIKENQSLIRTSEAIVSDADVKVDKFKEQLYLVTTNREYDALTAEIDFSKKEVATAEDDILNAEEKNEELTEKIKTTDIYIDKAKEELINAKTDLENTIKSTKTEKAKLEKDREEIVKEIPRKYLSIYKRIYKARNGLAVVPIKRDSCSGCHSRIIPQKRVEIYQEKKIFVCDTCNRFLYVEKKTEE